MCKGCGACASVCPTGAMTAMHFTDGQVSAMVRAALGDVIPTPAEVEARS